jgi:DNA-binding LytR/AlgR family response regulator
MQLKVKLNIDPSLPEEKAEFWLKKMTARFERITKELNSEQDFLWCYRDGDAYEINFSQIYAIQIENEKTMICTQNQKYVYRGRLYQVQSVLPNDFIMISRGTIVNYHFIDHLEIINTGNIDALLENGLRVQVSRRRIKDLKERLGL